MRRIAEDADDAEPDSKFSDENQDDQDRQQAPVGKPGARINEHADGNEEEGDEGVANGKSLRSEFVSVFGAAEEEAADKGAEGERKANGFGDGGDHETDGECEEKRDFVVAGFLYLAEERWNQFPAGEYDRNEEENGFGDSPNDLGVVGIAGGTEAGQQDGENNNGEIFDEGEGDHDAACWGIEFAAIDEQAHEHHGAGDGDDAADADSLREGPAEEESGEDAERDGERNAEWRAEEGDPFHFEEFGDGEFDANGKHQEDDTNFGHGFESVDVVDVRARSEWAEKEASDDVAENDGLAEAPKEQADDEGTGKDHGDVLED